MKIIINSPSLNPEVNVSGISSVTQFIISNNKINEYVHFEVGRKDTESKKFLSRLYRIINNTIEWKKLLKQNNDAIIHYNIPLMKAAIIRDYTLLKIAYNFKLPIVLHIHGGNFIKERKRPRYIKHLLEKIFSWAKAVIVLSEKEKTIIEEDFKLKNIQSLPNCISLSEARQYKKSFNKKHSLSILYLGRIEKNKGIDYILEAAKKIKSENIPFMLHFAGKEENLGEYIPLFQKELGDNFTYHGIVYGKEKTELLKECDIFILPSFYEGLPMSLLEAMSFGLIPIVTPVGSIPTVVQNQENGIYIKVKDYDSIINAIKILNTNNDLNKKLSENTKNTILNKFNDVEYINTLNNIYKNIL